MKKHTKRFYITAAELATVKKYDVLATVNYVLNREGIKPKGHVTMGRHIPYWNPGFKKWRKDMWRNPAPIYRGLYLTLEWRE